MKSVLLSIRPEYCAMIINTTKTLEIRKNKPKQDTPFKCYIYCTVSKPYVVYNGQDDWHTTDEFMQTGIRINGKVIGEFICDAIYPIQVFENETIWYYSSLYERCLSYAEMTEYIGVGNTGYAWHISNLVIYDKPKDLSGFSCRKQLTRPPQSWCYVDTEQNFRKSDTGAADSCYFCKNMYFCGIEWKCKLNHITGKACSQYDEDVERKDAANQCLHLFDTKCS